MNRGCGVEATAGDGGLVRLRGTSMTEEGRRKAGIDHDVMSRQAGKYRARLEFWRGRAADLKVVSGSRALQRSRTDR